MAASYVPTYLFPPPPAQKPSLSPFYYGLVVVGSTAMVLALYNILVVGICAQRRQRLIQMQTPNQTADYTSQNVINYEVQLITYSVRENHDRVSDLECSVCLTNFADGEEVRLLTRCKHCFHASCIDMWLHSHSDCPLCRTPVGPPVSHNLVLPDDNSREVLRGGPSSLV